MFPSEVGIQKQTIKRIMKHYTNLPINEEMMEVVNKVTFEVIAHLTLLAMNITKCFKRKIIKGEVVKVVKRNRR